jgi:N-acetylmuramoyl-L-alanine amidase
MPPEPPSGASITSIAVDGDALRATVMLDVIGPGRLRSYALASPPRIILEGEQLSFAPELATVALPDHPLIADFRFGAVQASEGRTEGRLVIDLKRPARVVGLDHAAGVVALSIQISGIAQTNDEALIVDLSASAIPSAAPAQQQTSPNAPRRTIIMIDAGHGGKDPGAVTDAGIYEKDVVLAVARRLQTILAATSRYDVRMTREADVSVTLDRRLVMARLAQPDLFISLHADTFAGVPQAAQVRGGAVYVLTDKATSRLAAALADKENAADQRLGLDVGPSTGNLAVDSILNDLTTRESATFASAFQSRLVGTLKGTMQLARDPARGAAFKVLKQAGTPAVLIELGYMSNAQDVALMQTPQWQTDVAAAILRAVDGYFSGKRSVLTGR